MYLLKLKPLARDLNLLKYPHDQKKKETIGSVASYVVETFFVHVLPAHLPGCLHVGEQEID